MLTKILSIGDIQICPNSYKFVDKFLNEKIIDIVKEEDIDYIVLAGDLFEYSQYSNNYVSSASIIEPFSRFFYELSHIKVRGSTKNFEKSVKCIIVDGNHDKSYGSYANANDIFKYDNVIHASNEIFVFDELNCSFVLVPWLMPHEYSSIEEVVNYISSCSSEIKERNKVPILVSHMRVVDLENTPYLTTSNYSFTFTKSDIEKMGIEYGILGDIHKKQNVINEIDYIGCIRQRNFGESGNPSCIRLISIDSNLRVSSSYRDISIFPEYFNLSAESEDELKQLLDLFDFKDSNYYRINVPFNTSVSSKKHNVDIRGIPKKTKRIISRNVSHDLNGEELIKVYNEYTKEFSVSELDKIIVFWKNENDK
jgi:DNA repair exonuclease SbcCD nuclease subunit